VTTGIIYACGIHREQDPEDPKRTRLRLSWPTNAELVADVAALWLDPSWRILDPTHGVRRDRDTKAVIGPSGLWWKKWTPDPALGGELVAHDLALDGIDFRDLPYPDDHFDAAAFDPEYAPTGGYETSTVQAIQTAYGRGAGAAVPGSENPEQCQAQMHAGLAEVARTVRPGGRIIAKSQGYTWNNAFWDGTYKLQAYATETLGLIVVDRFEHPTDPKPQPLRSTCIHCGTKIQRRSWGAWTGQRRLPPTAPPPARRWLIERNRTCRQAPDHEPDPAAARQVHAHRNISTLLVFEVPRPAPATLFTVPDAGTTAAPADRLDHPR
jgi:hypothetical protein